MPFKPATPTSPALAAAVTSLVGEPVTVRDYSEVSVVSVKLSEGEKEMYFGWSPSGAPIQSGGSPASRKTEEFRRKTEEAAVRTWSFRLTSAALYDGCGEQMQVSGGSLKRSLHDFMWLRGALVAEFPGVIVPPITADAASGDASILERFLARVLAHDLLKDAPVLKCFVLSPPSEFIASQRDFVADGAPPPLHVQANALFLRTKEFAGQHADDDKSAPPNAEAADGKPNHGSPSAMSGEEIKRAQEWCATEHKTVERALQACAAASLADAKASAGRDAADAALVSALGDGETPPEATAAAADRKFGPATALPLLRDALGHLQALNEAIAGREKVRRSLRAAKDNHQKHIGSNAKRGMRLKSAERHSNSAKELQAEHVQDSTKKAKNVISAIGFKAVSGVAKTAAGFASQQNDVDNAAALVARLEEKYKQVNDRLAAEISHLQADWPPKLRHAFDAYLAGERQRARVATQGYDSLKAALQHRPADRRGDDEPPPPPPDDDDDEDDTHTV